ncbi:MAG TPA: gamma-glutamyl-gamma-aminobutyrate hydrolase family protein [Solirubrobacteraceae bacterium]
MRRPVIGICAAVERARWSAWDVEAVLLPRSYSDAVQRAGGLALLLPPDEAVVADPDELLDRLDGLILAGGADLGDVPERDRFEMALALRAFERDLPLLGICRGMQLMNVARGGTLIPHLPDTVGHEDHRRTPGSFDNADHDVRVAPGSLAERVVGETVHSTKSHHHQGVDVLAPGLQATGWATIDDLPEALEDPRCGFALGVQWHPEADDASPVIAALVEQARARLAAGVA